MNFQSLGDTLGPFEGRYLGIDPSLTSTGLAYLDRSGLTVRRLRPKLSGPARLAWLDRQLALVLDEWRPTLVMIEGYAYSKGNSAHQIGEWGGLVRLRLYRSRVSWYVATPQQLKKFVTGKGSSGKGGMIAHLITRWGVVLEDEDEADAAGLALLGYHKVHRTRWKRLPAANAESIDRVESGAIPVRERDLV